MPAVSFKSGGQLLIIGPAAAALDWAERLSGDAGSERADHRGARRRAAARAQVPGLVRQGRAAGRLAGRLRGRVDAGESRSTSRPARAATPASAPAPSRRSTTATRSTWTSARRTARASRPAARSARSTSRAPRAPRKEVFDLVLDLSREPLLRTPRAAPGLRRAGRRSAGAGARGAGPDGARRRIREAALLQVRGAHLRAQPLGAQGLRPVPRGLLQRRDHGGRRQGEGRAAPLRGLRRLRHGVPVGRHDLRLPARAGHRRAPEGDARDLPRGRRQGRVPPVPRRGRGPQGGDGARAPRQGAAGARDPAGVLPRRFGRHRPDARRDRLRREPGLRADHGDDRGYVRGGAGEADGDRPGHPARARLRGRAFLRDRRGLARGEALVAAAGRRARAGGDLQPRRGEAHLARFRHRPSGEAGATGAGGDRAARGCAVRRPGGGQGDLHAVQGLHRRLPGGGAAGCAGLPAAALHRAQLRAVRPVRRHLSGGRDPPRAAAAARRAGEEARDAERGRTVQLRALRQALRHARR